MYQKTLGPKFCRTSLQCLEKYYSNTIKNTICFNERLQMMKIAFHITLNGFFVLNGFKFLLLLLGNVVKAA